MKEKLLRTFIALDLSDEAIKEITNIQEQLEKNITFIGKYTEPENLHLTLKFLGEVNEEKIKKVKEKLSLIKHKPLEVKLGESGIFNIKGNPKVIWVKLNGQVFDLQKTIDHYDTGMRPSNQSTAGTSRQHP